MEGKWQCAGCEVINENTDKCVVCSMTYDESAEFYRKLADAINKAAENDGKYYSETEYKRQTLERARPLGSGKRTSATVKPPEPVTPIKPVETMRWSSGEHENIETESEIDTLEKQKRRRTAIAVIIIILIVIALLSAVSKVG